MAWLMGLSSKTQWSHHCTLKPIHFNGLCQGMMVYCCAKQSKRTARSLVSLQCTVTDTHTASKASKTESIDPGTEDKVEVHHCASDFPPQLLLLTDTAQLMAFVFHWSSLVHILHTVSPSQSLNIRRHFCWWDVWSWWLWVSVFSFFTFFLTKSGWFNWIRNERLVFFFLHFLKNT